MVQVRFDGVGGGQTVKVPAGLTLMEAAVQYGIEGLDAECGGACACATCHVYIAEEWRERVGEPRPQEAELMEGAKAEVLPNSRLSCQIKLTEDLDGLSVTVP
jgi:ferredoxin, 2Fe-2S